MDESQEDQLRLTPYLELAIKRWLRLAELTRRSAAARAVGDPYRADRWDHQAARVELRLGRQVSNLAAMSSRAWILPTE